MKKLIIILILALPISSLQANAVLKDTLKLSLPEVEGLFLKNNLLLLASKFDIDAAKAEIVQSRLWTNPSIYLEQNIYNPNTKKAFDVGKTGENVVQIQQLFLIAGKRNKRINLAEINTQIAEYQFYDLMRTLKYELRSVYFDTYFKIHNIEMYDEEIASLKKTLEIFKILIEKGAIANKEVIRVKSLLLSLESERLDMLQQIYDNEARLNILLNLNPGKFIYPMADIAKLDSVSVNEFAPQALQDSAMLNRFDLKIHEQEIKYQQGNLSYQKALAVPDLRLGGVYDRAGSYIQNYYGVTLQMDLPTWNRNQGNIALARSQHAKSQVLYDQYKVQVILEVAEAYRKSIEAGKLYNTIDKDFRTDFETLMDIIIKNYEKRNITLIEFIDYYEAFKSSMLQISKVKNEKAQAIEQLNFFIGKNIVEY